MKIHVIGAEGYIGQALCARLERTGGVRLSKADAGLYGQALAPDTALVRGAGEHILQLKRIDPDVLVYLGALAHDPGHRLPDWVVFQEGCMTPSEVGRHALRYSKRMVFVSSLSVFAKEGAYPHAKRMAETHLFNEPEFRANGRILRFGTVFGVTPDSAPGVFRSHLVLNNMVYCGLHSRRISITGDATKRRPVLSLNKATDHLMEAIFNTGPCGTITNHWDTTGSLADFAETVRRYLDGVDVTAVVDREPGVGDSRNYGWGWYDELCLREELVELHEFVRCHHRILEQRRTTEWDTLYKNALA